MLVKNVSLLLSSLFRYWYPINNFFFRLVLQLWWWCQVIACYTLISVFFLQQVISASWIVLDCSAHGSLSLCCHSYMDPQWLPILGSTSSVCRSCRKSSTSWDKGGLFCPFALFPCPQLLVMLLLNSVINHLSTCLHDF